MRQFLKKSERAQSKKKKKEPQPHRVDGALIVRNVFIFLITARKRSLWQGNIFTGMCQSFCP